MSERIFLEDELLELLNHSTFTYDRLISRLNIDLPRLKKTMSRLREKGEVRSISKGCRQIFYRNEDDKERAEIDAIGKYALTILDTINKEGPKRTHELSERMNARSNELKPSLRNLVAKGLLKSRRVPFIKGGLIYYKERASDQELSIKSLGTGEERAYRILMQRGKPITSTELAKEMNMSVSNAGGIATRLVNRGLIFKTGKKSGYERAIFYTTRDQSRLAEVIAASPKYGKSICNCLVSGSKTTPEISVAIHESDFTTRQALDALEKHGVVVKRSGRPNSWSTTTPIISSDSYERSKIMGLEYLKLRELTVELALKRKILVPEGKLPYLEFIRDNLEGLYKRIGLSGKVKDVELIYNPEKELYCLKFR